MHLYRKRLLLGLALLAGLYGVLYLLPANLFLGTGIGPRLVNRRPERLRVEWGTAWSLWPGRIEVRGLRIEGDNRRVRWAVAVERGRGRIDLPALLGRTFRVSGFAGEGVSSRVTRHPPEPPPRSRPRRRSWTIQLDDLRLSQVRALQYGPLRLEGEGRAAGSFRLVFGGETEVEVKRLEMERSLLSAGGQPAARGVSLRTALRLGPYAPRRHPGTAGFDFLSGTLQATGEMDAVRGLRKVSRTEEGATRPGTLVVDLRVERGALRPGSRMALAPPAGNGSPMTVAGAVRPGPMGPRLVLDGDLRGLVLRRSGGRPPLLESESLNVSAVTSELRLSRLLVFARDLRGGKATPGWTLPGEVRAEGLRLTFPGSRASLEIEAGSATGRIDLPALLRREVRLDGVRAEQALLRVTAGMPPPDRTAKPSRGRWSTSITGLELEGGCDVDLSSLHLDGGLVAAGDLSWNDGALALDNVSFALSEGRLSGQEGPLAHGLSARAGVRFGPYRRQEGSWIDFLSGTLQGAGTVTLKAVRSGRLTLDLQVEKGALLPGSEAELRGPRLAVTGSVVPEKDGPRLALAADLRRFALGQGPSGPPLLASDALRVTAATSELHLVRLFTKARGLRGGQRAGGTLPGDLEAEGLRLHVPGTRVTLSAAAARASGKADLSSLLRREIRIDSVRAERARVRLTGGAPAPARSAGGERSDWTAQLADLRLDGGCEVALAGLRFDSALRAGGDLSWNGEALSLGRVSLGLANGRLRSGGETVARELALQADGRLDPFDPARVEGIKALRLVSGRATFGGAIASLGFLDPYLAKASWLALGGDGKLQADFQIDRGRLLPGSRFAVRPARLRADYLLNRATGLGALTAAVERKKGGDELDLRVELDRFAVGSRENRNEPPHVQGRGLRLALVTQDLDLARSGKDFKARLDLPQADITDLTFYNLYLPQQSGIEILSGTGRIQSWLEMETERDTGRGEVAIRSQAVRVRLYDQELTGALEFRAPLSITDLRQLKLRLDGTRLSLDRVVLRETGAGEEAPPAWWARLDLTRATMDWTRPMSLTSSVRLAMKDSGLLLSLFSQRKRYLRWFQGLLTVEDIVALGELRFDRGAVVLDPLRATGRGVELRSRLRLSKESQRGYLLVRHKRLVVGLELQDGKRDYRFVRPVEWFESRGAP